MPFVRIKTTSLLYIVGNGQGSCHYWGNPSIRYDFELELYVVLPKLSYSLSKKYKLVKYFCRLLSYSRRNIKNVTIRYKVGRLASLVLFYILLYR